MWRILAPIGLLLSWFGSAHAAGYDDFSRGVSATNRHADDQAVSLFSSALAAGDLNANLQPVAYLYRGRLYLRKGYYDRALADFSSALKLKSDYREALGGRAEANVGLGNFPAASADLTAAIKATPGWPAYYVRARVGYYTGDFMGSVDDLKQAMELEPQNPYLGIWLGLAELRAGHFGSWHFAREISQISYGNWPYHILWLLQGDRSPDSVMRAATQDDDKGMLCEADFYIAEWHLISGEPEKAKPLLQDATSTCPSSYIELEAARIEISRLH